MRIPELRKRRRIKKVLAKSERYLDILMRKNTQMEKNIARSRMPQLKFNHKKRQLSDVNVVRAHHLAHQVQGQGLELLKKSLLRNPNQKIGLHRLLEKQNHLLQSLKESRHPQNLPEDHHHPQEDGLPHRFVEHLYPRPHLLHLCTYQSLRRKRKQIKF